MGRSYHQRFSIYEKKPLTLSLYISDNEQPEYVTDPGCREHCVFKVPPINEHWPERIDGYIDFEIARTEMIGTFVDEDTGVIITTLKIEFLPKTGNRLSDDHDQRLRSYDPEMCHLDHVIP